MSDVTADGLPVGIGSTVWRTLNYGYPRQIVLTKTHLYWMRTGMGDQFFSTEGAALAAALTGAERDLKRARAAVKSGTKRVAELKRRLKDLPMTLRWDEVG
jgi:hypothetical protein